MNFLNSWRSRSNLTNSQKVCRIVPFRNWKLNSTKFLYPYQNSAEFTSSSYFYHYNLFLGDFLIYFFYFRLYGVLLLSTTVSSLKHSEDGSIFRIGKKSRGDDSIKQRKKLNLENSKETSNQNATTVVISGTHQFNPQAVGIWNFKWCNLDISN